MRTPATAHSAVPQRSRPAAPDRGNVNILIDPLPSSLVIDGRAYPIDSNFRASILFEQLIMDGSLTDEEKAYQILDLYFTDGIPSNTEAAFGEIEWFYRCGFVDGPGRESKDDEDDESAEPTPPPNQKRIYDFDIDAPRIFAAFWSQYRIDLNEIKYLHWWKFSAMFQALHEDEEIMQIMSYRSMDLSKIKDKDSRNRYAALQRKYALPIGKTVEEKISMAGNAFAGGWR